MSPFHRLFVRLSLPLSVSVYLSLCPSVSVPLPLSLSLSCWNTAFVNPRCTLASLPPPSPLSFQITGPEGDILLSDERIGESDFSIVAKTTGLHTLCFGNWGTGTMRSRKLVSFNLHLGAESLLKSVATRDDLKVRRPLQTPSCCCLRGFAFTHGRQPQPLTKELAKLKQASQSVQDEQAYIWAREIQHAASACAVSFRTVPALAFAFLTFPLCVAATEMTNSRVLWFTVIQAVILVVTAVWRVLSLQKFFEHRGAF